MINGISVLLKRYQNAVDQGAVTARRPHSPLTAPLTPR